MRTVAIIQARLGSTRLPSKVLAGICGRPMLEWVVRRTGRARRVDEVVIATTTAPGDEALVSLGRELGVEAWRGSEQDVLDRYVGAARNAGATRVVRITSDCPFVDPALIDQTVGALDAEEADYASNSLEPSFPRGLDTEVMTFSALSRAHQEATLPFERVHVTPYLYRHPELFRLRSVTCPTGNFAHLRWTVDTPEDLSLVRAISSRLGDSDAFSWRQALAVLEAEPELARLNAAIRQKALEEG